MKTSIIPNGDTSDKNNCRPIAIVTAMSKLFELCLSMILDENLCTGENQFRLTLSDPGYFRQLTIRGRALKAPLTISKTVVSIFTISYMCILLGVLGMFQLEFFKNSRFCPFYSDFKIKSSENSCKNNIFVILFKIDFKYTKRRRILMRI